MPTLSQRTFSGGEITPLLYARADIDRYQTSLKTCRNMTVLRHGGATNRGGTQFICSTKYLLKDSRLIPFIFNVEQTYVLEFGDQYMRVLKDGALVKVTAVPAWGGGYTYIHGDICEMGGINYYCIVGNLNQQPPNATYWYALEDDIFEIPTPYVEADLNLLHYVQSADVITLTHQTYPVMKLARYSHIKWILSEAIFAPDVETPQNVGVAGTSGSGTYIYHVTAIDPDTAEESLAGIKSKSSLTAPDTNEHTITWDAVSGISEYNIYMEKNNVAGFLGVAGTNSYSNDSDSPDTSDTPPTERNPFDGVGNHPSTSGYYQQRHCFSNTTNNPEQTEMSKSANFKNFTKSSPMQDDDAVTFKMAGSPIKFIIPIRKLIMMTSEGAWVVSGDAAGIIRAGEINPEQICYYGCGDIKPLIVGSDILFVQARGSIVRDLTDDTIEGRTSDDLTIFSSHLFDGYTVVDWAYQETPHSTVWVVRSDGVLLGFTFLRKQKMFAWHRHDTDGLFKRICVIPEGINDNVYFIVERIINGNTVKYIERMNTRRF